MSLDGAVRPGRREEEVPETHSYLSKKIYEGS